MTLRDYARVVREQWVLVLAGLVIGLVVAGAITFSTPRQYSSSVVLYVAAATGTTNAATAAQANYQGSLLSEQRVKSYTQMITSERVTAPALAQVPGADPGLGRRVTATAQPDTVLITATATDTDPQRAAAMANAVAGVFSRAVATLEQPQGPAQPPSVTIQVFAPAVPPVAAVSPKPLLNGALGAVLGLVLGLGVAVARTMLDTRIKSTEDVARITDAPNLGAIAFDKKADDQPLVVESDPQNPRAEAYRQIRTNLQFVDVESERKVVVVTSSLPAEGKSLSVCNLALALRAAGLSVAVVEGDLRRPRVADYFGLERTVGLTSVLTGRVTLSAALQPWRGRDLQVLASGVLPPNPSELLGSRNMQEVLEELGRRFAVVLVDAPPLLPVTDAAAVGRLCDGAVVLVRHGETTRSQLQTAIGALESASVRVLGTILNRVPTSGPNAYAQYHSYYRREDEAAGWGGPPSEPVVAVRAVEAAHTVPLRTRSRHSTSSTRAS